MDRNSSRPAAPGNFRLSRSRTHKSTAARLSASIAIVDEDSGFGLRVEMNWFITEPWADGKRGQHLEVCTSGVFSLLVGTESYAAEHR